MTRSVRAWLCLGLLVGCGDDGAASGTDGATSTAATPGSSDSGGATVGPTTGEPPPTTGHGGGILDPKPEVYIETIWR